MSETSRLSPYFAKQAVKGLELKDPLATHVERILGMLDPTTEQAKVADIHALLFPFASTASANKSLNTMLRQFNELAEQRGRLLRLEITTAKSGGPARRFVWFEGPTTAPPTARTDELDSIPQDRLVASRGTNPGEPVVVLITYNEHETAAVLARFGPGMPPQTELRGGRSFTLLGSFNGWKLVHLISRQGEDHSQLSTSKAVAAWAPTAVIGVGIAFGADKAKQEIGDVLVSDAIQGYELARVNKGGGLTPRDTGRPASGWLLQRFLTCDHLCRSGGHRWPTVRFGVILSGSKLVDDLDYRDSLVRLFPQGIVGGEMEGVGLAIAADDAKVDWIVVKGICDWGDGNKGNANKDRDQRLAADHAVAVVAEALRECPEPSRTPKHPDDDGRSRGRRPIAFFPKMLLQEFDAIGQHVLIDNPRGMPTTMDKDGPSPRRASAPATQAEAADAGQSSGVDVMSTLHAWIDDPDAPPVFAILGEYGMGKTVTAQRLARELATLRDQDPTRPAALYFDLRSVTRLDQGVPTLAQVVEECMARNWIADEDPAAYTWGNVLAWLSAGSVVIFDGLDEVLVKLDAGDGQTFTRTLLTIVDEQRRRTGTARVVVTCRTQYFRTLREQSNHFSGQERGNTREEAYRSLVLLPLTETQILTYLAAAVPGSKPEDVLDMLRSVHDLTDLTHRPYTLKLVSEFLPDIEDDRAAGRTVYGVTLYRRMVTRWLERDAGKHHLRPEDKVELAQHLAAHLHRTNTGLLKATDLEDWMHAWLDATPRLARRYRRMPPDQLEEDLRTATFLARIDGSEGSGFRFAHTSLAEYFHACHLSAAIVADDPAAWDITPPSSETLDFLGQLLAERADPTDLARLSTWGRERGGRVSRLILEYAVASAPAGWPTPSMCDSDLEGADLQDRLVAGVPERPLLDLRGACLRGANLRGAAFRHVDLTGADLALANAVQTTFADSHLARTTFAQATCTRTAFVRSDITGVELETGRAGRPIFVTAPGADPVISGPSPRSAEQDRDRGLRWIGHTGGVRALAYSPDGTRLASAGIDGTVRIWDPATATPLSSLTGHTGGVQALAYSPDGTRLASAGIDGTVRIWDPATATPLSSLTGHTRWVQALAYSPDGTRLASAGIDGTVRIWDPATATPLSSLTGHTGGVQALAYSPDGTRLASAGDDGTVRIWDPATATPLSSLTGHTRWVQALAYSPDGTRLASAGDDGTVRIWDPATATPLSSLTGHTGWVQALAYSPDGTRLASAGSDGTVRIWDPATATPLSSLTGHTGWVQALAYSPDGTRLASAGDDGTVRIWDPATATPLSSLTGHTRWVQALAYSPDGTRLASAGSDGTVRIWDPATATPLSSLTGHTGGVQALAYSPDGTRLASAGIDGTVRIWDPATATPLSSLTGHTGGVRALAYSPDGTRLASAGIDGTVRIWDPATATPLSSLTGHTGGVQALAYSPDGTRLASAGIDGTVRIWDPATATPLSSLTGHTGWVQALAYSPDGTRLASAGIDGTVRIWDPATATPLSSLTGHTGWAQALAYSPDGTRLASAGSDGTVRIWDPATATPLSSLTGHTGGVQALAYSPDGTRLASAGIDGTVRIWDPRANACVRVYGTIARDALGSYGEVIWDPRTDVILHATGDAWRCLIRVPKDAADWSDWQPIDCAP